MGRPDSLRTKGHKEESSRWAAPLLFSPRPYDPERVEPRADCGVDTPELGGEIVHIYKRPWVTRGAILAVIGLILIAASRIRR
jgi:hypothetical protein